MSHVDEGLLHAWIDGAFPPGDPDGDAITAHVDTCAECAVRAEEARRLKQRAGEVLQYVAPDAVRVEPFDRMVAARRAARATGPQRARRRSVVPMAWAASIMLAITAGWMARAYLPMISPDAVETELLAPAPMQAPASLAVEADETARRDADAASRGRTTDPTAVANRAAEPARTEQAAVTRLGEQQAQAGAGAGRVDTLADVERRDAVARSQAVQAAAPPPTVAVLQREANRLAQATDSLARAQEEAAKAVAADAQSVYRFADAVNWADVSLNTATRLLGRAPLRVDTLPVEGVHAIEAQGLVRLRQRIADGVTLELLQRAPLTVGERAVAAAPANVRGMAFEAVASDVLAAGDTPAISLQRDGVLLVVRAPIPLDSLRALIARIR